MPRRLIAALSCLLVVTGCGAAAGPASAPARLRASSPARPWHVAFDGYGSVVQSPGSGGIRITLVPARPASPRDTHAALVLSRRSWRDLAMTVRVRTNRQLRRPHPNPWEVGWLLWHYRSDRRFYYLALKPDGWELGKTDPAYPGDQRFLATGTRPAFPPGRWYTVGVQQRADVITVAVNGRRLVRFIDTASPYRYGKAGLYTEDASATFQPIAIGAIHSRP